VIRARRPFDPRIPFGRSEDGQHNIVRVIGQHVIGADLEHAVEPSRSRRWLLQLRLRVWNPEDAIPGSEFRPLLIPLIDRELPALLVPWNPREVGGETP